MDRQKKDDSFSARLRGIRPIMFDRYGGDNKTKLPDKEKIYLTEGGLCAIPVLNVYSMLCAENTPSVAKRFYGKQGRDVALGVMSFASIEADGSDPLNSPICDKDGKPYRPDDPRITVVAHVARLPKGVPNLKSRPMIPTGWSVIFHFTLQENPIINIATLKAMVEQGGILGLGTFRPIFGRYCVDWL